MGWLTQKPPCDVHLMDALVADVATPGVEIPMPIVVELRAIQIDLRGRSAPKVVIDRSRDLERPIKFADARARLVARADDVINLPEFAFPHILDRLLNRDTGSGL